MFASITKFKSFVGELHLSLFSLQFLSLFLAFALSVSDLLRESEFPHTNAHLNFGDLVFKHLGC